MIQLIERLLQRLGLIDPFDKDDVINATIDNAARDSDKAIEGIRATLEKRFATNHKLRESIQIAKRRTNSFEQFERQITRGRND